MQVVEEDEDEDEDVEVEDEEVEDEDDAMSMSDTSNEVEQKAGGENLGREFLDEELEEGVIDWPVSSSQAKQA